jgi:hypothetical protein
MTNASRQNMLLIYVLREMQFDTPRSFNKLREINYRHTHDDGQPKANWKPNTPNRNDMAG